MEDNRPITVEVKLDKRTFRTFAFFDTFVLKKRWIRPAIFCAIMTSFGAAALFLVQEQPWLIAGVLFAAGAGLPAIYVLSFLSQVNAQARKNKLSADCKVYTLTFSDECVTVKNERRENEVIDLKWADITAYRRRNCVYLYVGKNRAFLLPDGQDDANNTMLWEFIASHSGAVG